MAVYFFLFVGFSLYLYWQTPPEWWKIRHTRILLSALYITGFCSLLILITFYYRIPDGFWKNLILYSETAFFSLLFIAFEVCLTRQFSYYTLRHFSSSALLRVLGSKKIFIGLVLVLTALYLAVGIYNADHLVITSYTVTIEKSCEVPSLKAVLIADLHVGAGSSPEHLDDMVQKINKEKPDVVLIAGDVSDSSSSENDLAALSRSLSQIESSFGVFYAEGNHESQTHYDPAPYLERAGVVILRDEAVELPGGIALVGQLDESEKPVSEVLKEASLSEDAPCLVIRHRPVGFSEMDGGDLVLCGHSHGFQYPASALTFPYLYENVYGYRAFGERQTVTTCGVSVWGYHASWPSKKEIVVLTVDFTGKEASV